MARKGARALTAQALKRSQLISTPVARSNSIAARSFRPLRVEAGTEARCHELRLARPRGDPRLGDRASGSILGSAVGSTNSAMRVGAHDIVDSNMRPSGPQRGRRRA